MDSRDLGPDDALLNQIFPDQPHVSIDSIFVQTWDKCVFKASFPHARQSDTSRPDISKPDARKPPPSYLIRLEVVAKNEESTQFATVSAMQQIASLAIPKLIPKTYRTGMTNNAQRKLVQFSVTKYIKGKTLEDVWEQMSDENQQSVMAALVEALQKLHSLRIPDSLDRIRDILAKCELPLAPGGLREHILGETDFMGGPSTGFFAPKDGPALLSAIDKRWELSGRPFYAKVATESGGVVVQSEYSDLGFVKVEKGCWEEWYREAVLCHNDLNPRNIIVSSLSDSESTSAYQSDSSNETSDYELSAIIDWELSGFYPPSYELSLQDTYLSGANRLFSFYSLLKSQMKDIVPRCPSQISLLQVIDLIFESIQRRLREGNNIPAIIRERFIQRLQLRRDEDPYLGWVPKDHEAARLVLSFADVLNIERDVVAEREARREAKAASRLQVGTGSDS
ncbi:hypothetical protein CLIM01_07286 [Colletotrichum limetticola]|uniref:Aminoglycoside phosphotransferase domain-containing protein n=1 Tax=Colletotrichum limetticola TaxID=1209924 RepID=A0ABQ9PUX2_9PEZI|nr:hypothetical protein CLIM01_07286 [Colletotrichum limetticola]